MSEFKLSYTASEINEKLGKVGQPIPWAEIEGKPVKQEAIGDTLTWDGNTEGRAYFERSGSGWDYYKVSDTVPERSDLANGASDISYNGVVGIYDANDVYTVGTKSAFISDTAYFIHEDDAADLGAEPGTYLRQRTAKTVDGEPTNESLAWTASLTIPGYTFTKEVIKPDHIPQHSHDVSWNNLSDKPVVSVGSDTLEWDGNTEGLTLVDLLGDGSILLSHVSDIAPSYDAVANGFTVSFHDNTEMADMIVPAEDAASMAAKIDGVGYYIGWYNVLVVTEQNEAYSKGVYLNYDFFVSDEAHITYVDAFTVNGYTGFTKEQIDPAVLPDALQFGDTLAKAMPETEIIGTVDDGSMVEMFAGKYTNYPSTTLPVDDATLEKAVIVFDGKTYTCNLVLQLDFFPLYGNASLTGLDPEASDTGEPFAFIPLDPTFGVLFLQDEEAHTVSISVSAVKRVAEKYLPTRKTFCINYNSSSDIYLYTDTTWTTKVTMEDLQAADEMYGFRIQTSALEYSSCYAYKLDSSAEGGGFCDYAKVTVFMGVIDGTPTWKTYYTAKYTAS